MPLYEYQCGKCGTSVEVIHGVSEKGPATCKEKGCRGRMQRQISAPAFQFKGSGWYVTDYGKGGSGGGKTEKSSDSESSSASESSSSEKSGSDSKAKDDKKSSKKEKKDKKATG